MASHHHHHHNHHRRPHDIDHLPTDTSCVCNCNPNPNPTPCCTQSHHASATSPMSAPPSLDHIIQLIGTYPQNKHFSDQICFCEPPDQRSSGCERLRHRQEKIHRVFVREDKCQQHEARFVLSSLLQRIDALESSLQRVSVSSDRSYSSFSSLRDAAARVIQTHYRLFLVRRSKTLRHLKELALVKSSFHSLKSSISGKTHFDFESVSRKAMDLLIELDSFQGGDPMIKDGKRSLRRELVSFLDYIDECVAKRHEILLRASKNVRFGGNNSKSRSLGSTNGDFENKPQEMKFKQIIQKIRDLPIGNGGNLENKRFIRIVDGGEEFPVINLKNAKANGEKPRVKKTVSFDEKRDVYRVYGNTPELTSSEDGNSTDGSYDEPKAGMENNHNNDEEIKRVPNQGEDDQDDTDSEESSSQSSDGGKQNGRKVDNLVFSAPVPLKMEI